MKQAIRVKHFCPTNTLGSRFVARASAGSVSHQYDYETDHDNNATEAAKKLCAKFGWNYQLAGGKLPDGSWIFVDSSPQI